MIEMVNRWTCSIFLTNEEAGWGRRCQKIRALIDLSFDTKIGRYTQTRLFSPIQKENAKIKCYNVLNWT